MKYYSKLMGFPLLLVLYEISTYLSNDMYLPGLPSMMRDLHLSIVQVQLTLTMWFAGAASMPLVMGMISDRVGRRPVLIYGGLIYVAATLICATTTHFHLFLAARYVEGCMIATMGVAGYACIHESHKKIEAIKLLALMGSISILAPAIGPLLGSLVLLVSNWRMIFWLIAIFSLIIVLLLAKMMPETLLPHQRVKFHPLALARQYRRILTNKLFLSLAVIDGLIFGGFIMWITASPLLLIASFHFSEVEYGIIQAGVFAANMVGNHVAKIIIDRLGVYKLIWFGLWMTVSGGVLMLLTILMPDIMPWFIMTMTAYSFGSGLCFAVLNRSMIEASDAPMGMRLALANVIMTSCGALGSVAVSLLFKGTIITLAYPIALTSFVALGMTILVNKQLQSR